MHLIFTFGKCNPNPILIVVNKQIYKCRNLSVILYNFLNLTSLYFQPTVKKLYQKW